MDAVNTTNSRLLLSLLLSSHAPIIVQCHILKSPTVSATRTSLIAVLMLQLALHVCRAYSRQWNTPLRGKQDRSLCHRRTEQTTIYIHTDNLCEVQTVAVYWTHWTANCSAVRTDCRLTVFQFRFSDVDGSCSSADWRFLKLSLRAATKGKERRHFL
jgi:hypothetical protein